MLLQSLHESALFSQRSSSRVQKPEQVLTFASPPCFPRTPFRMATKRTSIAVVRPAPRAPPVLPAGLTLTVSTTTARCLRQPPAIESVFPPPRPAPMAVAGELEGYATIFRQPLARRRMLLPASRTPRLPPVALLATASTALVATVVSCPTPNWRLRSRFGSSRCCIYSRRRRTSMSVEILSPGRPPCFRRYFLEWVASLGCGV